MQQVMAKYVGKSMDLYPTEEMLTDMITIYQRHLSKDDVDGLIAFYGSAPGQHLLDAQPVIMHEYMPMVMERMKGMNKVLADDVAKELKDYFATLPATDKK